MWWIIIVIFILFTLIKPSSKQLTVGNYTTSNFEISPDSRSLFYKMQRAQRPEEYLRQFLIMEDRFLEYEKESVCMGRDKTLDSITLDQNMRNFFTGFDFTYHNKHLKQIAENLRKINPYLECFKDSKSSKIRR